MENTEIPVCECLVFIILKEIKLGNSIRSYNSDPKWPEKDSKFVFLENRINLTSLSEFPDWISVRVNNDMHYTWRNEIYCKEHHDLLVAGEM